MSRHWIRLVTLGLLVVTASTTAAADVIQLPFGTIPDFCIDPSRSTIRSARSGPWADPATWDGGQVPAANQIARISAGHTVTIDSQTAVAHTTCVDGTLRFSPVFQTRLTTGIVLVQPTGLLEIGTATQPIAETVTAELLIRDQPLDTSDDGTGVYDPAQYGTGLLALGKVTMHGAVKTPTFVRLSAEPRAGQTSLSLSQAPTGWRAGDKLVIPDTRHLTTSDLDFSPGYVPQWEELTIQGVSGTTVTLTSALSFDHLGARDGNGVLDFLPHVGNLTRNIIIRSENPAGTRGHVLLTHRADIDIRYARFTNLGRTTIDPLGPGNQIGRYSLHMHHVMGPVATPLNGYQYTLIGNAVENGRKWGITVHNSHYGLVQDHVVYNVDGAGLMTEDGSESFNVIERNFIVRVNGPGGRGDNRGNEFGWEGSGFWLRGPNNYIRNNVVTNLLRDYGYKLYHAFIGNVRIPNFKGADTSVSGQYTLTQGNSIALLEFSDNEVYGATSSGLTFWWLGVDYRTPRATADSVIRNLRVWHVHGNGIYNYHGYRVVIDGFIVRGKNPLQSSCCPNGFLGPDYYEHTFTLRNADIQGMGSGITPTTDSEGPQTYENIYLRNVSNFNIGTMFTSACTPSGLTPRTITLRNYRADPWPGTSAKAISMDYSAVGPRNLIQRDELTVYDYNGQVGNNFRVYYREQAPDFIVPQSVPSPYPTCGGPELVGSPVSGLTNQQNWDTYGIAIAGSVAPCTDTTTRLEIAGITCALSGSTPPPLATASA